MAFSISHPVIIMWLTPDETKQQTRRLWQRSFPNDTAEFLDIYFEEKYRHDNNLTLQPDGTVVAAMQLLPYRMTFYGEVLHAGYVSGLCVDECHRGKGLAAKLLGQAHRKLYRESGAVSFLIPGNEDLRHFYEQPAHGAYWTSTFRRTVPVVDTGVTAAGISLSPTNLWPESLYVFYHRQTRGDFALHAAENDFFAAVQSVDAEGGLVVEARKQNRLVGLCLATASADGRVLLPALIATDEGVQNMLLREVKRLMDAVDVYMKIPCAGDAPDAVPYAMARVVDAERFLSAVARRHPEFDLVVGVDGDLDVPENNGIYHIHHGRVDLTDDAPVQVLTPGGLAALFLGAHPMAMDLMLDE
ncbi:MAG: GNAT family N-acetyltransferase [Alloprevotella sp.]